MRRHLSKTVECEVMLETINAKLFEKAIDLLTELYNAKILNKEINGHVTLFVPGYGHAETWIEQGKLHIRGNDMIIKGLTGIMKQTCVAAYIMGKARANKNFDKEKEKITLELYV